MTERVTVIGAGPAGLAVAACLEEKGIAPLVLEGAAQVGSAWRKHYDRLRLHTHKGGSALPGLPFPSDYPLYPSRDQFVAYLDAYARRLAIAPAFDEPATRIARSGGDWVVTTPKRDVASKHVVVATGLTRLPHTASWPGLGDFRGPVLHSSQYRNGAAWTGKRVLVVGLGNSGGEIAIDLHEHGAFPTIALRSPINVVPRRLFGLPILAAGALFRPFGPKVADQLSRPLLALAIGRTSKLGLRRPRYGPLEQIAREGKVPLIDVGTLALVRKGQVKIAPGIERFTPTEAIFEGGLSQPFDAVVLATGYRPALTELLPAARELLDDHGLPRRSAREAEAASGLHFCGFRVSPRGMLNEIGLEARAIAETIASASTER